MMEKINIGETEIVIDREMSYLQVNDISRLEIAALWERLTAEYGGYDVMFCFHNTETPAEFLKRINALLVDDSIELRLTKENFCNSLYDDGFSRGITRITEDNFDVFASFHDKTNPDMFWKSGYVRKFLDDWDIFISQSGGSVKGYIMTRNGRKLSEIYCVEGEADLCAALIARACGCCFEKRGEILYMADVGAVGLEAAVAAGFCKKGRYRGYRVRINNGNRQLNREACGE